MKNVETKAVKDFDGYVGNQLMTFAKGDDLNLGFGQHKILKHAGRVGLVSKYGAEESSGGLSLGPNNSPIKIPYGTVVRWVTIPMNITVTIEGETDPIYSSGFSWSGCDATVTDVVLYFNDGTPVDAGDNPSMLPLIISWTNGYPADITSIT